MSPLRKPSCRISHINICVFPEKTAPLHCNLEMSYVLQETTALPTWHVQGSLLPSRSEKFSTTRRQATTCSIVMFTARYQRRYSARCIVKATAVQEPLPVFCAPCECTRASYPTIRGGGKTGFSEWTHVICHSHSVCTLSLQNYYFSSTFTYLRSLFSLKSVKTVPVCTDIQSNSLPLPANSQTMERKSGAARAESNL